MRRAAVTVSRKNLKSLWWGGLPFLASCRARIIAVQRQAISCSSRGPPVTGWPGRPFLGSTALQRASKYHVSEVSQRSQETRASKCRRVLLAVHHAVSRVRRFLSIQGSKSERKYCVALSSSIAVCIGCPKLALPAAHPASPRPLHLVHRRLSPDGNFEVHLNVVFSFALLSLPLRQLCSRQAAAAPVKR